MRLATVVLIVLLTVVGGLVHTPTAAAAQCGPRLSAYEGYRLRTVTLNTPFPFVRALGVVVDPSRAILPPAGSSLRTATVNDTLRLIEQSVDATPVLAQPPFTVTVAAAYIDNCDDEAREIDLIFYVLTSRFVAPSSFSWEFGETLRRDPATAAGLSARGPHLSLEPVASFNESDKFVAGARAAFVDPSSNFQLSADGAASQRYTNVAASASGSHDFEEAALWCASYGVGYRFQEQPLEHDDLRQGYAFGWVSAVTRPFPALGAPVRYAIQLEEGFQASQLAGAGFTSDTRYTALKLLTGASGGTSPHDYSLNLGWQLGSRDGFSPDWSKLLLDGAYTVRVTPQTELFDHRSIDVETRVAAGWLFPLGQGRAPQNERFFGGVRPRPFTEISDWDVRSVPFIRGYPNNRLHALLTGDPSGREHFVSLNLTVALTTWRLPLLPRELYTNEEFLTKINAQKNTAREVLLTYHESRDPAIAEVEKAANDVEPVLTSLQTEIESLTVPDDLSEALELCQESVEKALATVEKGRTSKSFGLLLNRSVRGGLPLVIRDCEEDLNASLDRPEIHAAARRIEQERVRIEDILQNRVDHQAVERRADEDFAIVDRALTAFVHEINLVSVDPVVLFDTAYIGPTASSAFVRHSVGGGLRVTLGSTASFTLGYAANLNRAAGEPRGSLFFELKVFDLIR